jgi:transposase
MNDAKYIGLDVHQATISVAILDSTGKLVMEAILETKSATILQFIGGLRGSLHVTFEEGTWAAWLHDLLKPQVSEVLVCDPRKNNLGKIGNKNDRNDARELAALLYQNRIQAVYHGEQGLRTLKELARSYLTITRDLSLDDLRKQLSSNRFEIVHILGFVHPQTGEMRFSKSELLSPHWIAEIIGTVRCQTCISIHLRLAVFGR